MSNKKSIGSKAAPWLVSIAAITLALWLAEKPILKRIGYVVSDDIARGLGVETTSRVVLVRLDQTFPKEILEDLLSHAIPTLVNDYHIKTLGIDIDFFSSTDRYGKLARNFAASTQNDANLQKSVVWAVSYDDSGKRLGHGQEPNQEDSFCEECFGKSCRVRFIPRPVFGTDQDPENFGLSIALTDIDNINRSSPRFVCHSDVETPIETFHFRIVETYCARNSELVTCRDLQPNRQARTRLYSWYHTEPIDLCRLVECYGDRLGSKIARLTDDRESDIAGGLANKIAVLYSDETGNDEHMTMLGTEKGAAIVASLVENELQFGTVPHWRVSLLKWAVEIGITALLLFLFHWQYTESWAILLASGLFVGYLSLIPKLSHYVPDFRNYVFAMILAFWIEVLLKSAVSSIAAAPVFKNKSA